MSELRDLMFFAEPAGSGVEVIVDRFLRYEEEEKNREVMGLSALRRAQELERLVSQGDAHRNGMSDADLASHLIATKAVLKAKWGKYTCARYLLIAKHFEGTALATMDKWEMRYGRSALLYGLDRVRSATTAAQTCEDMTALASTLYFEQACKIRTSLGSPFQGFCGRLHSVVPGLIDTPFVLPVCPPDLSPVE